MTVLGIETSCDETSAAVVNDQAILSNIIRTQTIHQAYGGVVPEFASRAHLKQLVPIINIALAEANLSLGDLDGIDDDGNGYADDVIGYDFLDGVPDPGPGPPLRSSRGKGPWRAFSSTAPSWLL